MGNPGAPNPIPSVGGDLSLYQELDEKTKQGTNLQLPMKKSFLSISSTQITENTGEDKVHSVRGSACECSGIMSSNLFDKKYRGEGGTHRYI